MDYEVSALTKSISVLECIANSEEQLGVSEIVRRTRLSKNMVFRICQTLVQQGWIESHDPGPRYSLTLKPFQLFSKPLEHSNLNELCITPMKALRQKTGETVYLSVRDKNMAVNIVVFAGSNTLHVAGTVGSSYDLHACAQGKIQLAFSDNPQDDLRNITLKKHTEKTITSKKSLQKELQNIRQQGYAVNDEELGRGLIGCAAPVFDHYHSCIAAVGLFATSTNTNIKYIHETLSKLVCKSAQEISERLGHKQ
ncbi:MAG: IclR family transcriptional regulator [Planctomycetes bacterium]|nr:IclR family transcriptional regulator [Planctomycetota bacterium]